ncbi:MAG: hypothetical protein ACTHMJ_04670 [Thermomicrobiales bacterium]
MADGRAPQGMTAADVRNDIQANLIPDATLIPAMVGEVSIAQQHGYSLVFVPSFRP